MIGSLISSCSKENAHESDKEAQTKAELTFKQELPKVNAVLQEMNANNPVSFMGEGHNTALNRMLDKLTSEYLQLRSYKNDRHALIQKLKTETADWIRSDTQMSEGFDYALYSKVFDETGEQFLKKDLRKLPLLLAGDEQYWNAAQFGVLKSLDSVVSDSDDNIFSILSRIKSIENRLPHSGLDERSLKECFAMTSIASNTMVYWYTKSITPSDPFELVLHANNAGYSWKDMGKADLGGAIIGAVRTAAMLFIGPIGWKVWAANVLGSAAGASVAYGIFWLME